MSSEPGISHLYVMNYTHSIFDLLLVLCQNGYFDDDKFMAYLRYLQYWHRPEYSQFIQYPV